MKGSFELAKTTIVGGILVILPITVVVIIVAKAVAGLRVVIDPLAATLPGGPLIATAVAIGVILVACFATGTVARTAVGERVVRSVEHGVLERIPGYEIVRSLSREALGHREGTRFAPALVSFDDSVVPAFVVEEHADGRYTVFVPAVPTPAVGAVYIVDRERVRVLDVPFAQAVRCITQWGVGSGELLRAVRTG